MVIADQTKALALAGIMGGEHSGVTVASSDIFLESAFFAPEAIAGKAREFGFGSDSSFRYERGVDFQLQREAMERATGLVLEICGGQPGPIVEETAELPRRGEVKLRVSRCAKLLGVTLSSEQIGDILSRLGLTHSLDGDVFTVAAPSFRFDIAIEEDLIEEVARVYGYDAIPSDAPRSGMRMLAQREELRPRDQIRHLLAARDYQEIVSYAFVDEAWERDFAANEQPVRLINPIASQMSVMRSTLIGGLVDVLVGNINRKQPRVRVFEVARVFKKSADWFDQPEKVAGLAWGRACRSNGASRPSASISSMPRPMSRRCCIRSRPASARPNIRPSIRALRRSAGERPGGRRDRRTASQVGAAIRSAQRAGVVRAGSGRGGSAAAIKAQPVSKFRRCAAIWRWWWTRRWKPPSYWPASPSTAAPSSAKWPCSTFIAAKAWRKARRVWPSACCCRTIAAL